MHLQNVSYSEIVYCLLYCLEMSYLVQIKTSLVQRQWHISRVVQIAYGLDPLAQPNRLDLKTAQSNSCDCWWQFPMSKTWFWQIVGWRAVASKLDFNQPDQFHDQKVIILCRPRNSSIIFRQDPPSLARSPITVIWWRPDQSELTLSPIGGEFGKCPLDLVGVTRGLGTILTRSDSWDTPTR